MKYIFVLIFIIAYTCFGLELGYTVDSPWHTHLTFNFQHSGIIHLIINSLAFISMFRVCSRFINKYLLASTIITGSFLISFLAQYPLPTVGASAMIYIMIGIYIIKILSGCSLRTLKILWPLSRGIQFIIAIFICLIISLFKENSNFWLHLLSLSTGTVIGAFYQHIKTQSK